MSDPRAGVSQHHFAANIDRNPLSGPQAKVSQCQFAANIHGKAMKCPTPGQRAINTQDVPSPGPGRQSCQGSTRKLRAMATLLVFFFWWWPVYVDRLESPLWYMDVLVRLQAIAKNLLSKPRVAVRQRIIANIDRTSTVQPQGRGQPTPACCLPYLRYGPHGPGPRTPTKTETPTTHNKLVRGCSPQHSY